MCLTRARTGTTKAEVSGTKEKSHQNERNYSQTFEERSTLWKQRWRS